MRIVSRFNGTEVQREYTCDRPETKLARTFGRCSLLSTVSTRAGCVALCFLPVGDVLTHCGLAGVPRH